MLFFTQVIPRNKKNNINKSKKKKKIRQRLKFLCSPKEMICKRHPKIEITKKRRGTNSESEIIKQQNQQDRVHLNKTSKSILHKTKFSSTREIKQETRNVDIVLQKFRKNNLMH